MKPVVKFLKNNGFEKEGAFFVNDKCRVLIGKEFYTITDNDFNATYSEDLNIYWLIGFLTYYGYIDKNYKS